MHRKQIVSLEAKTRNLEQELADIGKQLINSKVAYAVELAEDESRKASVCLNYFYESDQLATATGKRKCTTT